MIHLFSQIGFEQNQPIYMMVSVLLIVIGVVIIPLINVLFPLINLGKPDVKRDNELVISGKNSTVLSRVLLESNRLLLVKKGNIDKMNVDVIYFVGKKKKKYSYKINFIDDSAVITAPEVFNDVAVIVTSADNKVVNKKSRGYPNIILNILASLTIGGGFAGAVVANAYLYDLYLIDIEFMPYVILYYIVPIIVGVLIAVLHYFVTCLVTNSFNGGKK